MIFMEELISIFKQYLNIGIRVPVKCRRHTCGVRFNTAMGCSYTCKQLERILEKMSF